MDPVQPHRRSTFPRRFSATLVEIGEEINSSLDLDEVLRKNRGAREASIDYEIFSVLLAMNRCTVSTTASPSGTARSR